MGAFLLPWLACVGLLVATKVAYVVAPALFYDDPRMALFDWPAIAAIAAAGALGIVLAQRSGLTATWDARHPFRARLLPPLVVGAALGLVAVPLELASGSIEAFLRQTGLPRFNMPLPASILFYAGGAVVVEVVYRLVPLSLLYWLSGLVLRGGFASWRFWLLAVATSLIEPASQLSVFTTPALVHVGLFGLGFAFNLAQAYFFRRSGFVAAIATRLGYYAVWHIGYGDLICNC